MSKVDIIIKTINEKFPDSSFLKVASDDFKNIEQQFGKIPPELKELYTKLGYGGIGDSYFRMHLFLEPSDIYDADTAQALDGILIIGDDFAGTCYAYDTKHNWIFGYIDTDGTFEHLLGIYSDFIDFLEKNILDK